MGKASKVADALEVAVKQIMSELKEDKSVEIEVQGVVDGVEFGAMIFGDEDDCDDDE